MAVAASLLACCRRPRAGLAHAAAGAPVTRELERIGTFDAPVYVDNAPGIPSPAVRGRADRHGSRCCGTAKARASRSSTSGVESRPAGSADCSRSPSRRTTGSPAASTSTTRTATATIEIDEFKRRPDSPTRADRVVAAPGAGHSPSRTTEPQRRPAPVRARRQALHRDRRRRRGGDAHDNARRPRRACSASCCGSTPASRRDQPYTVPADESRRRRARPRRDLRVRAPQPVAILVRLGQTASIAIGDVGQRALSRRSTTRPGPAPGAPTSAGPQWEGNVLYDPTPTPVRDPAQAPIFTYPHASCEGPRACAVTGGYVVRDPGLPSLPGRYLYADLYVGDIRSFVPGLAAQATTRAPGSTSRT